MDPTQAGPPKDSGPGVRLQKLIAEAGLASRRAAENLIREGRVSVNGEVAALGARADPASDVVTVDGKRIITDPSKVYLALNKPPGVISTAKDPGGRPTVTDLVGEAQRVFPVGRLDAATEGLIILTNDGELSHKLTHPSFAIAKTYVAEVEGRVSARTIQRLRRGMDIGEERPAAARSVRTVAVREGPRPVTVLELTIHEGRNHVVRRMLDGAGHPVLNLVRTAIGPLRLGRLAPGGYRKLSPGEVASLYEASGDVPGKGPGRRDSRWDS